MSGDLQSCPVCAPVTSSGCAGWTAWSCRITRLELPRNCLALLLNPLWQAALMGVLLGQASETERSEFHPKHCTFWQGWHRREFLPLGAVFHKLNDELERIFCEWLLWDSNESHDPEPAFSSLNDQYISVVNMIGPPRFCSEDLFIVCPALRGGQKWWHQSQPLSFAFSLSKLWRQGSCSKKKRMSKTWNQMDQNWRSYSILNKYSQTGIRVFNLVIVAERTSSHQRCGTWLR